MGSLDEHKDVIISQLLHGDWENLFPKRHFSNLERWFSRHQAKESVVVRFTFYNKPKENEDGRYALYLTCEPAFEKGKVKIKDLRFCTDLPLAIPPILYEKALYAMPDNLLEEILKKKDNSK